MANPYYTYVPNTKTSASPPAQVVEPVDVVNLGQDANAAQTVNVSQDARFAQGANAAQDANFSPGANAAQTNATPVNAYIIDEAKESTAPKSRIGSAVTLAVGGAIAAVGVPMLILPGPGLLAIGGGVVLMAKGAKGLFGK